MDALLRRRIMMMAGGSPTPPGPTPTTETITLTRTDLFAGKSCGGYINVSTGRWSNSTKYYGVIIDMRGYEGKNIRFERADGVTLIRYGYLTDPYFFSTGYPKFSTAAGYTSQITNESDTTISETIPSDAHYMYVYVYSNGSNVAPTITITASVFSGWKGLAPTIFETNTTIGANGTVYTGSSAPTVVCSTAQSVPEYTYCKTFQIEAVSYPSGVDAYRVAIAEYTTKDTFIRRDGYSDFNTSTPASFSLAPECSSIRIMIVCKGNGTELSGDVVRFDETMLKVKVIDNS